jgi:hypothetical protein
MFHIRIAPLRARSKIRKFVLYLIFLDLQPELRHASYPLF